MVFPQTVLDQRVEINLNGTWTDISTYVYQRDGANTTTRGRQPQATQISSAAWNGVLDNRDGRFSSRNPTGPYYGNLKRSTPIRWSVPLAAGHSKYMRLEDDLVSYASCPDSAALDITGDLELQADFCLSGFYNSVIMSKWDTASEESWILEVLTDGTLKFFWTTDGSTIKSAQSTVPIPLQNTGATPNRRVAVKVTLDVDNGASGNTVTFYTSTSLAGSWTQLGDPVIQAGTTSVFASTAAVTAGDIASNPTHSIVGKFYGLKVISGIGGTVKASPDFTAQTAGATSFNDAQSNTWTLHGSAAISDRDYRFHGEISSLPPRWDVTNTDIYMPATASGVWARASANSNNLSGSAMYRAVTQLSGSAAPNAYWPCEDLVGSTQIASGLGGSPMILTGTPVFAAETGFACSMPIPTFGGSTWTGTPPSYAISNASTVRFLMHIPAGGTTNGAVICRFYTTGTVHYAELTYGTGGTLNLTGFDTAGAQLFTTGNVAFGANGDLLRVSLELLTSGSNITYNIITLQVGATVGSASGPATLTTASIGRITKVVMNPNGTLNDATSVGHIVANGTADGFADVASALNAWNGETAAARFYRIAREEGYQARIWGYHGSSVAMGNQPVATFSSILQECETADGGMIFEPRESLSLGYRPLSSIVNQSPTATAHYTSAELSAPIEPMDDMQRVTNDVTASRTSGSSSHQTLATGGLSTQAPPNGINPRPTSFTVNVQSDDQLDDEANWALHIGTVDELLYPVLAFKMSRSATPAAIQDLDIGDYIKITNTTAVFPPGDVNQIVEGFTENAGGFTWDINPVTMPESPFEVAVTDNASFDRVDTDGSVLASALTSSGTTMPVLNPGGAAWTTAGGDVPFDIVTGGERMTVTAVGTSSRPGMLVGAFLSAGALGAADFTGALAAWNSLTSSVPVPVTRLYKAQSIFTYDTSLSEMVTAGKRVCLTLRPAYNPVSSADRASMTTLLQTLQANGADVEVTLWHEPFFSGLTAAQYQAMIAYYGPTVRQYYPLWHVCSGTTDTTLAGGYFPGGSAVDGVAVDAYAFSGETQVTDAQILADTFNLPFGVWEFNGSFHPGGGDSQTTVTNHFTFLQSLFQTRVSSGMPCGNILFFSSAGGGWSNFLGTGLTAEGGFEGGIGTWVNAGGSTVAQSAAQAHSGSDSLAITSTGVANARAGHCGTTAGTVIANGMPVTPGQLVGASGWFRAATVARSVQVQIAWFTSAGASISTISGGSLSDSTTAWTQATISATAPATAAFAVLQAQVISPGGAGEVHYLDDPEIGIYPASNDLTTPVQYSWDYRIGLLSSMQSALSGSSSPQQLTVTRAVNGVVKAHSAGDAINVAVPCYVALT